ncbi:MAG TPA: amphi-Trp domain-containing protein [Solirubrobacteraceae bacterium]|nr:amphi-Trp domain-containing protein [Solirubrobacteraceae bacterium]
MASFIAATDCAGNRRAPSVSAHYANHVALDLGARTSVTQTIGLCASSRLPLRGGRRAADHNAGEAMDIFEIKQTETVGREEAAARLRGLADMLARQNDVEFDRGGMHFKVHVPDQVRLKVELEVETDERELEIELKW